VFVTKLERDLKSRIIWDYSRTDFHTDFSVTTAHFRSLRAASCNSSEQGKDLICIELVDKLN
jgi:hypothetical protein